MPPKFPLWCWCWVLVFFAPSPLKSQVFETAIQYADLPLHTTDGRIVVRNSTLLHGKITPGKISFFDAGNQGRAAVVKLTSAPSEATQWTAGWVTSSGSFSLRANGSNLYDETGTLLSSTALRAGDELIIALDGPYLEYRLNAKRLDIRPVASISGQIEAQFSGNGSPGDTLKVGIVPFTIIPDETAVRPEVNFLNSSLSIHAGQNVMVCAKLDSPNRLMVPLEVDVEMVEPSNLFANYSTRSIRFLPGDSLACFSLQTASEVIDPAEINRLALKVVDPQQLVPGEQDTLEIILKPDISPSVSVVFTAFDNQTGGVGHAETDQFSVMTLQDLLPGSVFYLVKGVPTSEGTWDEQEVAIQNIIYEGEEKIPVGSTICFSVPATCDGDAFLANGFTVDGKPADFLVSSFGIQRSPDINLIAGENSSLSIVQGNWTLEDDSVGLNGQIVTSLSVGASTAEFGATNTLPEIETNGSQYAFFTCDKAEIVHVEELRREIAHGAGWTVLPGTADNDLPEEVCSASCDVVDSFPPPIWSVRPDTLFINCQAIAPEIAINQWVQNYGGGIATSEVCGGALSITNTYNHQLAYACSEEGLPVTFIASDTCGGVAMVSAPVFLENNQIPVFQVLPTDTTVACMPDTLLASTFQDWLERHGGAKVTSSCGVGWSYTYQWEEACADEHAQAARAIVTFVATDYCGQSISHTAHFTIDPVRSWVLQTPPTNLTLNLGDVTFDEQLAQWLNNQAYADIDYYCTALNWSHDYTGVLDSTCGVADVTFTAVSSCGDSYQITSRLTVQDTLAPQLSKLPEDLELSCANISNISATLTDWLEQFAGAQATDNQGTEYLTWSLLTDVDTLLADNCFSKTVWFEVKDFCGNALSYSAQLIRNDNSPPTVRTPAGEQLTDITTLYANGRSTKETLIEAWLANNAGLVVYDDCTPTTAIDVTYALISTGSDGHFEYSLAFSDRCGNTRSVSRSVQIIDNAAPVLSGGNDLYLTCDTEQSLEVQIDRWLQQNAFISHFDQSNVSVRHDYQPAVENGSCLNQEVLFTFTDAAGNESYQRQEIIHDVRAPKITLLNTFDTIPIPALTCGEAVITVSFTWEEACNRDTNWLNYTTITAVSTSGASITPTITETARIGIDSFELSFLLPPGEYDLELTTVDQCKNTASVIQRLHIISIPLDCVPVFEVQEPLLVRESAIDYAGRLAFLIDSLQSRSYQLFYFCTSDTSFQKSYEVQFDSMAITGVNQSPLPPHLFNRSAFCDNYSLAVEIHAWNTCGDHVMATSVLQLQNDQSLQLLSGPKDSVLVPADYAALESWIGNNWRGELTVKPYEDWLRNNGGAELAFHCGLQVTTEVVSDESCFAGQTASLNRLVVFTFSDQEGVYFVDSARFIFDYDVRAIMNYPRDTIVTELDFVSGAFDREQWLDYGIVQDSCNYLVQDSIWVDSMSCVNDDVLRIWNYYRFIEDNRGRTRMDTATLTLLKGDLRIVASAYDTIVSPEEDWDALATRWMHVSRAGLMVNDACRDMQYEVDTIGYIDCPNRTWTVQFTATDVLTNEIVFDTASFTIAGFGSRDSLLIIPPKDTLLTGVPVHDDSQLDDAQWVLDQAGARIISPCGTPVSFTSTTNRSYTCGSITQLWIVEVDHPALAEPLFAVRYMHDTLPENFPMDVQSEMLPYANQSPAEMDAVIADWLSGACADSLLHIDTTVIDCPEPGIFQKVIAEFTLEYRGRVLLKSTRELSFIQDQISVSKPADDQFSGHAADYQNWKNIFGSLQANAPCEEPVYSVFNEEGYANTTCGSTRYEVVFQAENYNGDFVLDTAAFVLYSEVPAPGLVDSIYYVTDNPTYASSPQHEEWASGLRVLDECGDLYTTTRRLINSRACTEDPIFGTWTYQLTTQNSLTGAFRYDTVQLSVVDVRPALSGGILFDRYMVHDGTNSAEIAAAVAEWKNTFPDIALANIGCKEVEVIEYAPDEFIGPCSKMTETVTFYEQDGTPFIMHDGELNTVHLLKMRIQNELGDVITVLSRFYEIYEPQAWTTEPQDVDYQYQQGGPQEVEAAVQAWISNHGGGETQSPCPDNYPVDWTHEAIAVETDVFGFGTYTVAFTATVRGTNRQLTRQATFTVAKNCSLSITANHQDVRCYGGNDGQITVNVSGGTPGYDYLWSTNDMAPEISGVTAGIYQVTVTDAIACTAEHRVTLSEPSVLNASISKTDVSCNGGSNGSALVSVSGGTPGYSYRWNTGAASPSISNLKADTYRITVTDGNGCTAIRNIGVSQPTALSLTMGKRNMSCPDSDNGRVWVNVSGGVAPYSYQWSTNHTASTVNNLGAGIYEVTVTDGNGCQASNRVSVGKPSLAIYRQNAVCFTGGYASVQVKNGAGSYTYRWSNGATGSAVSDLNKGDYWVEATDAHGCTFRKSFTIEGFEVSIEKEDVTCLGGQNGSVDARVSFGHAPYTYEWSNGSTSRQQSGLRAGTYRVTVRDATGCQTGKSVQIKEPVIKVSTQNVSCPGGQNGRAEARVEGGSSSYSYRWSNNALGSSVSGLRSGSYTVTVTDNRKSTCWDEKDIYIAWPFFTVIETDVSCSGARDGSARVRISRGVGSYSYRWSTGATSSEIKNLGPGNYWVDIADEEDCITRKSFSIKEPSSLRLSVSNTKPPGVDFSGATADYFISADVSFPACSNVSYSWDVEYTTFVVWGPNLSTDGSAGAFTGPPPPEVISVTCTATCTANGNTCSVSETIQYQTVSAARTNIITRTYEQKSKNSPSYQNLRLFPNPTSSNVYVEYQNETSAKRMEVEFFDKAGRLHKTVKQDIYAGHNRFAISIGDLPPGLYIVRTKAGQDIHGKKLTIIRN